jgi:MarR family 2-MHQ and catechol resistance regulon transcriptional repressor
MRDVVNSQSTMLWIRFALTFDLIYKRIKNELKRLNLTIPQLDIIVCLARSRGLPLSTLGERLLITPGNVTGIIDRLERDGYVYRDRDYNDRRVIIARLTKKGYELYKEIMPYYDRFIVEIFSSLNQEEKRKLLYLLKKLGNNINNN